MEHLILAQLYDRDGSLSKKEKSELLKKVNVNYCIPDTLPGKTEIKKCAGYTSLHVATEIHHMHDFVTELVELDADPTKQSTERRYTPLHLAIESYSIYRQSGKVPKYSWIDCLLSKQVKINNTSNPTCKLGISHLHIACIVNHAEAVEFFVKAKVDVNQRTSMDCNDYYNDLPGYTALHCAIQYSSVEAANILLDNSADTNVRNAKGMSCVHLLLQRLLALNDFITMGKRTSSIPCKEEIKRLESIVKLIMKAKAEDGMFTDDTGLSALHLACMLEDKSILKDFLTKHTHVNMPVKSNSEFWPGWTPQHFAACCNIETMLLLMQSGGHILMKNLKGESALDLCAKRFAPADIHLVLSKETEFKNILLSDNTTTLSDLLLVMNDYDKFRDFMHKLEDNNVIVSLDSPIWSGYNLLHLSVSLNEKTKNWNNSDERFVLPDIQDSPECYNCTEDEESLYSKRIDLGLKYGCSVDVKNANAQTPIHLAFKMCQDKVLKQLLDWSKENVADEYGLSHLHIACTLGHLDSIKWYLNKGSDVNSRVRISLNWGENQSKYCFRKGPKILRPNSTPLHAAVVFGNKDVVEYLLRNNADVYAQDSFGFTPIHLLAYLDYLMQRSIGKLLLEVTPDLRDLVSSVGLSHLHIAVLVDNEEAVDKLLLNGADLEQIIDKDVKNCPFLNNYAGMTALLVHGMSYSSNKVLKRLLKAGANVYAENLSGVSALQKALGNTLESAFIRLVKKGKCEIKSSGMTLLHIACASLNIKWARKLIKEGAEVNARISTDQRYFNRGGATPLHLLVIQACSLGLNRQVIIHFVELLLENGADSTIECNGSTPLHLIYSQICADTLNDKNTIGEFFLFAADLLLKSIKSYDINPIDNQGFSYFHFACLKNDVETATKFLNHGIDVNISTDPFAVDNPGFTPLHFAMAYKSIEVAYLLLDRGADVNAQDARGNTPLHVAINMEFIDLSLFETVIRHGADINAKNIIGETLLYCLLGYGGLTLERLEFFSKFGCSINIFNVTIDFDYGIVGSALRSANRTEFQSILERLMQITEVKNAIRDGFDIIKSIVAVRENHNDENKLTLDNYLSAISLAINLGCDIDEQNSLRETALHTAVSFENLEATNALLLLGANINLADEKDEYPFSEKNDRSSESDVFKALACHAWKMKYIGLDLTPSNLRCLKSVEERFSLAALLEQSCLDELTKAKEMEIRQNLTVRDFLSELGAVAQYPRMSPVHKAVVNKFFENSVDLRSEFPEFCGLLTFQYRKALSRMAMWKKVKDIIALICPIEIPDLCVEAILRYLKNYEMEYLVDVENDLVSLFNCEQ